MKGWSKGNRRGRGGRRGEGLLRSTGARPVAALGLEEVELVGEGAEFVGAVGFFGEGGFAFGG